MNNVDSFSSLATTGVVDTGYGKKTNFSLLKTFRRIIRKSRYAK